MELDKLTTTALLLSLLVGVFSFLFANNMHQVKQEAEEPPFIPSSIPYFGHIIGLIWYKTLYYTRLSKKHRLRIYTLAMPTSRIYVINSHELVQSVQRQSKMLSFWFIEAKFTAKLGGLSKEAGDKLLASLQNEQRGPGLFMEGMNATHKAMMPGEGVDQMALVAAKVAATTLARLETDKTARQIDLWQWVQHEITKETTESVYGPMNPYQDHEIENGNFANDTVMLLAEFMPWLLASKGYAGREKVVTAFKHYLAAKSHETASDLVKARVQCLMSNVTLEDLARFESVNGIAILANTVPTAFWTMYHVFSDASILEIVREESSAILSTEENCGVITRIIDLGKVKDAPIFTSIIQESLRHRASGSGIRMVLEDTLLDDCYLLKKDSYLIIPNREIHFDENAWGKTVKDFDPYRFTKANPQKVHSGAFRGFGGGVNLCPGKLFAMREITALVAMFALRFDIKPSFGPWVDPQQDTSNMSLAIAPPKKKVLVDITPRNGWEGGSWTFKL